MKYCIDYYKTSKIINEVDELTITYNKSDTTLLDFLDKYKEKRINIYIEDLDDFNESNELKKISAIKDTNNYNIYLKIPYYNKEFINKVKEKEIKFFLETKINSWDGFVCLINLGVSDIYVVEELCFELDKCADLAHQNNIQLRTFPNVAQSKWEELDDIKKFFIRPEDVKLYEDYIDVLEFFGTKDKIDAYYKIYKDGKQWFGQLNEIIIGFNNEIDNRYIIPRFPENRIKCGKKCLKGGSCHICDRIEELSYTLQKSELIVKLEEEEK